MQETLLPSLTHVIPECAAVSLVLVYYVKSLLSRSWSFEKLSITGMVPYSMIPWRESTHRPVSFTARGDVRRIQSIDQ